MICLHANSSMDGDSFPLSTCTRASYPRHHQYPSWEAVRVEVRGGRFLFSFQNLEFWKNPQNVAHFGARLSTDVLYYKSGQHRESSSVGTQKWVLREQLEVLVQNEVFNGEFGMENYLGTVQRSNLRVDGLVKSFVLCSCFKWKRTI